MLKKGLPIIFIHWGDSDYLKYSLSQAKLFNPSSDIILISDIKKKSSEVYKQYDISKYYNGIDEFIKTYVHRNTISEWYTLFWFKRWFVLNNFIKDEKIIFPFLIVDSDVLLYSNVSEVYETSFKDFDITINGERGPQYTFFRNQVVLSEFHKTIINHYKDENLIKLLEEKHRFHIENNEVGGVDDMTILFHFCRSDIFKVGNSRVILYNSVFDGTICCSEGFEYDERKKIKSFSWQNKLPYCKNIENGSKIKFNAIHFQGYGKRYMHRFYTGNGFFFQRLLSEARYLYYALKGIE